MTQAYNNVHSTNIQSVSTTHYYVRFKPQNSNDLSKLDSLDLELYDYPLDRELIQDGDYWPDAYTNLGPNENPWLYTVVEVNFQFPAGINYVILAPLNIPADDAALEDEAFYLTGNIERGDNNNASTTGGSTEPEVPDCGEGYHWDYNLGCVENNACPSGYHWDSGLGACVQDPPPPPVNLHPRGMITYKTYSDYGVIPPSAPVKYTRIVARRFFKIDKTYTDTNGNFQLSKRFPRKVTIIVKFKTSTISVRQEPSNFGLWKRWFPIKKNIGTYRGNNLQNLNYEFQKGSTSKKTKTRRWLAAVAINTTLETKAFLSSNSLIQLPDKLPIYLNPPNQQTQSETAQYDFIKNSYFDPLRSIYLDWVTSDINSMTTSKVTMNIAKQLGLVYLWKVNEASNNYVNVYGNNYINSANYAYSQSYKTTYARFGNGVPYQSFYNPDIIAMVQAFAQHLGHTIANRIYGWGETGFQLQGKSWTSSGGISSSSKYLEGFDPSIGEPNELFKWIPVGLINDLMDNQTDPFPIIDNASGFTYSDIQAGYYTEPTTLLAFKNALKSIKPVQAVAIDQLFASYGY